MPDADGVGQLLVKTPSCCRRKVGRGIERQPFTSDGYLETGDLFAEDAAGHLRYFGRKAEILTIKGEKVNSRSIDRVAALHPDVEFARTTSGKTDSLVLRLWAKDGKTLDLDGVKRFMGSHLRLHEIPEWFVQEGADVFHK